MRKHSLSDEGIEAAKAALAEALPSAGPDRAAFAPDINSAAFECVEAYLSAASPQLQLSDEDREQVEEIAYWAEKRGMVKRHVDLLRKLASTPTQQVQFTCCGYDEMSPESQKAVRELVEIVAARSDPSLLTEEERAQFAAARQSVVDARTVTPTQQGDEQKGGVEAGAPERGITDEELQAAREHAYRIVGYGKLKEVPLVEPPDNLLRLVWREPDGQRRRCSTFVPIDRDQCTPSLLAALAESPRQTAYLYSEVEHVASTQQSKEPNPHE